MALLLYRFQKDDTETYRLFSFQPLHGLTRVLARAPVPGEFDLGPVPKDYWDPSYSFLIGNYR